MVVECVGSSADVFKSVAAEIIGAMSLAKESEIESPVFDIVVSSIGILCVTEPGVGLRRCSQPTTTVFTT
ncbi:hypothetical protein DYB26_014487, partial [Aphanomyces astaci]